MKNFKKVWVWMLLLGLSGLIETAFAYTAPQVVMDPLDATKTNKVVQIQVENAGDYSWIYIPFEVFPGYSSHETLSVSFDMYRPYDATQEWFFWSWTANGPDPINPLYGGQDNSDPGTYPFVGTVTTNAAASVFDRWVKLAMQWDFFENPVPYTSEEYTGDIHGYVSSTYDNTAVDINYPLIMHNEDPLTGYFIALSAFNNESDVIYLDNFLVEGSPIYDANGFEDFELGALNGQDNWETSLPAAVPVPTALLLLASGIVFLVGIRR